MNFIIVGLGNPGEEYVLTRHNTGRIILENICKEYADGPLVMDKKLNALTALGKIIKNKVTFVAPETFMNNSGKSLIPLVKNEKAAAKLIVIYDDFSLPLGKIRVSFNRSAGGHRGLESIIKSIKTQAFLRLRVGTAPGNAKGNAKTIHGEDKIEKFILGKFKDEELKTIKKISKTASEAVVTLISEGKEKAMSLYNQ